MEKNRREKLHDWWHEHGASVVLGTGYLGLMLGSTYMGVKSVKNFGRYVDVLERNQDIVAKAIEQGHPVTAKIGDTIWTIQVPK